MHVESSSRPHAMQILSPPELEAGLLELFVPTLSSTPINTAALRSKHARLWRADAIHRARNMAQLTRSFAEVVDHPSRRRLPTEVTTQARRLSRAYEELGVQSDALAHVPCAALLTEITTRLADIFGRSRQIALTISAEAVLLPTDVRRALVLMASELVINALKYGYSTEAGGTITVTLAANHGAVELIVEDDGIGDAETYTPGQGGGLLDQLSAVIGAKVTRTSGRKGHGFRVVTTVPINVPLGDCC
jgi:two-component sensor histidine kinase